MNVPLVLFVVVASYMIGHTMGRSKGFKEGLEVVVAKALKGKR